MASFEMIYEEEEDVLEVTFGVIDENFARTIPINDNIVLLTDNGVENAWGISFYSYSQLLQVSETHLDALRALSEPDAKRVLATLVVPPISHFLEILDPADFRALVKAPSLQSLVLEEN